MIPLTDNLFSVNSSYLKFVYTQRWTFKQSTTTSYSKEEQNRNKTAEQNEIVIKKTVTPKKNTVFCAYIARQPDRNWPKSLSELSSAPEIRWTDP